MRTVCGSRTDVIFIQLKKVGIFMEYLSSLYRSAKRAVRRWFTLGLEDEFSQYDALSEYQTSLSADNLTLLRD